MSSNIHELVAQIPGTRCEGADNPFGSTITLDFGPLSLPPDSLPGATPHGWRHLTVYSPWRAENEREILFDWNVDGGFSGLLPSLVQEFVGQNVVSAEARPPGWDLSIHFANGVRLTVFGDFNDNRDAAWFILGTDGAEAIARPISRPLPDSQGASAPSPPSG